MHAKTYEGICATCKHAENCTLLGSAEKPVLECEEFEPGMSSLKTGATDGAMEADSEEAAPSLIQCGGQYEGLCADCGNRTTCALSERHKGVWECDDYRKHGDGEVARHGDTGAPCASPGTIQITQGDF